MSRALLSRPRVALGRALKSGNVVRNVATLVDAPASAKRELRPLSADQVRAFLDSIEGSRREALHISAVSLGLRQGALLGLRWTDVNLDAGTLTVRHYDPDQRRRTRRAPQLEDGRSSR